MAGWSFVSCSREAVQNGSINLEDYTVVDLILGLQTFPEWHSHTQGLLDLHARVQRKIGSYLDNGGRLLTSGSYVGADMISTLSDEDFTMNRLHYRWDCPMPDSLEERVRGLRNRFRIQREADEQMYGVTVPM